jgi:hypothetical protein
MLLKNSNFLGYEATRWTNNSESFEDTTSVINVRNHSPKDATLNIIKPGVLIYIAVKTLRISCVCSVMQGVGNRISSDLAVSLSALKIFLAMTHYPACICDTQNPTVG